MWSRFKNANPLAQAQDRTFASREYVELIEILEPYAREGDVNPVGTLRRLLKDVDVTEVKRRSSAERFGG